MYIPQDNDYSLPPSPQPHSRAMPLPFEGWQRFAPKMPNFKYSMTDVMKTLLTALFALSLTLLSDCSWGQGGGQDATTKKDTGTTAAAASASARHQDDEDFNVFLLAL